MGFYGRHQTHILFWPWSTAPFMVTTDLINGTVSKSVENGSQFSASLYPRRIPQTLYDGRVVRHQNAGYMDVLAPNDWVFVFVDPQDGDKPEPLFMGLLDRISNKRSISGDGMVQETVDITASGWEKVCKQTQAISSPYLSEQINFVNLYALGSAGQQPELSDDSDLAPSRAPGIGLFNDRLGRMIAFLMRLFLRTNTQPLFDNVVDDINRLLDDAGIVKDDEETEPAGNPALFGQFELPQVGIPLWYFVKLKFEELHQQVYVDPGMFLNQVNQSLAQFIDSFRNPLINELIYDVRRTSDDGLQNLETRLERGITGGYDSRAIETFVTAASSVNDVFGALVEDIAPYMILRKRPLFTDELLDLEGPTIEEDELIQKDVGLSDGDLHNLTMIETPGTRGNQMVRVVSGFPGLEVYKGETLEAIRRHGLRIYNDTAMAWPGDDPVPLPDPALTRDWDLRLHKAGLDNVKNYSGSLAVAKYYRQLFLGGKVVTLPNKRSPAHYDDKPRVYYVDALDYSFNNQNGSFSTKISVTRGQEANELIGY